MNVSGVARLVADPEQTGNGPVKFRLAFEHGRQAEKEER